VGSTRQRIVDASAELFRRQGYTGTGVKQIVAEASAPFGSLYHFFPGGKEQLGEEVIRWSGAMYIQLLAPILTEAPDPVTATSNFFGAAAETLRETDYADACPIATVALEVASTNEPMRRATAEVFESWIDVATDYFAATGMQGAAIITAIDAWHSDNGNGDRLELVDRAIDALAHGMQELKA
jgi:AcrR family transcriptional regulator